MRLEWAILAMEDRNAIFDAIVFRRSSDLEHASSLVQVAFLILLAATTGAWGVAPNLALLKRAVNKLDV